MVYFLDFFFLDSLINFLTLESFDLLLGLLECFLTNFVFLDLFVLDLFFLTGLLLTLRLINLFFLITFLIIFINTCKLAAGLGEKVPQTLTDTNLTYQFCFKGYLLRPISSLNK